MQAEQYVQKVVSYVIVSLINAKKKLRMDIIRKKTGSRHSQPIKTAYITALLDILIRKMVFKPVKECSFGKENLCISITKWMQLGL